MNRSNRICVAALIALGCGVASCGGDDEPANGDAQILIENFSPPGGGLIWTCPDGTAIALDSELSKQSTLCLGIDGSECPRTAPRDAPGPGDPECDDPAHNGFKDTCVEDYFSCFRPSGMCTIESNSNQTWDNGAVQDRNYMGFIAAYFQDPDGEPCITAVLESGQVRYRR